LHDNGVEHRNPASGSTRCQRELATASKNASWLRVADVSALFAYKLNWQSVLFFGYQEQHAYSESTTDIELAGRVVFLKLSYAFQR